MTADPPSPGAAAAPVAAATDPQPFDPTAALVPGVTLLEASAGTGKTYSITSLYLRLVIEERIPVEQILAVTFTQAATAELTSRIRKRLGEAQRVLRDHVLRRDGDDDDVVLRHLAGLAHDDDEAMALAERARAAVEGFDRANITTIHGFCQRMLSQHALEAQVPFGVELIEDQAQLVQEIADDFWARAIAGAEPWELQALATIGVDLDSMRRLARMAVGNWDAEPEPRSPAPGARPDASALLAALHEAAEVARHAQARGDIEALMRSIRDAAGYTPGGAWKSLPRALEALAHGKVIARDLETLAVLDTDRLRGDLPHQPLPPIAQAVTKLLKAHAAWRPGALPWGLALRQALVAEVRSEHDRRTRQRGVWSYDDLLRSLRDALTSPSRPVIAATLKRAIGERFKAVLIDEFQDTDPIQWSIFQTAFADRDHFLYLIGDPKQAIYGFRRADVNTYLEAAAKADFKYTLPLNHRSDRALVNALNHLFTRRAAAERIFAVPGIPYRAVDAKHDGRVTPEGMHPLRLLWVKRTRHNTGRPRDFASSRLASKWGEEHLPALVASDIVRTLGSGITIAAKQGEPPRALAPSDLAVLVLRNDQAVKVQDALRKAGVPAVVHGPRSVFETDEAADLLRVLTAVIDPSRMQNVRAALLTRLLGVTAIELATWEASATRQLEARIDRLREWREAWTKRSFIEAFRKLTSDRVDELLKLRDGERRLANHLQLGELLHLAVAQRDLKPPGLVAWLERQIRRADKTDDRQQVRLETDEPAVQVVTIHKAKGLEYPFVWCPYLWQKADQSYGQKLRDFVFRDGARACLQIGLDADDPTRLRAQRLQVYGEQSERLRACYVALTRAKHQVTLYAGAFYDLPESPLGYIMLSSAGAYDADSLRREAAALSSLHRRSDDELMDNLTQALSDAACRVEEAVLVRAARYAPSQVAENLTTRVWPPGRTLDVFWRRSSFSGLVQEAGADHEERMQAASDEDAHGEDLFLPAADQPVVLADLPSGRAIGNCIHKILELADFADEAALEPLVRAELAHFAVDASHVPALTRGLRDVLTTPLDPSGFRLADLPRASRLPELAFVFPVAGGYSPGDLAFTHRNLVRAFRAFGSPALESWLARFETAPFSSLRGFLSGSLDLAFRAADGRWYILDWKSNHLGRTARDYGPRKLRDAMDHHHYHLQYHLYAVALCRYLAARVPDFDAARDFGGAFYLFLRGMSPEHAPGTGVFFDRPSPSLLRELDRELTGEHDARLRQLGDPLVSAADWQSLLAPFLAAKVLSPLDYRFALALARIAPEPPSDAVILGAAAASAALTRGDICLELGRAATLLAPTDEDAPLDQRPLWPEPAAWRDALVSSPLVSDGVVRAPLVLDGERLYLHRYYDYQRRLARALGERGTITLPVDDPRLAATLERLFASTDPDPAQRAAAETAVRRGLTIISGGPGTGKTSTVVRILAALVEANPTLRAVLVAPTGKAATRLSESIRSQRVDLAMSPELAALIPEAAATVHRALGFRPQSPTRFNHDREHPLAADVVVLDEASMVDLAMMTKLVEAVPRGARLIMLGDKDQLASVAAGHVLGDIAEAAAPGRPLADCFALLTRSHRFSEDGGIGALARAIKAGAEDEVIAVLGSGDAEIGWQPNDQPDAEARLRELTVAGWGPLSRKLASPDGALEALSSFQLLCAHRRGRWGAEHLTVEARLWLAQAGHIGGADEWYPGRPVIVLVNDHAQDLWNGDTGVVLKDPDEVLRVHFPRSGAATGAETAGTRSLSIAQLPTHAAYYAVTIHKAQGSGFDHVVAVLPPEPSPVVTRELLYTAVTRARKKVTLVASEAVVRHAVRTRVVRASGLAQALSVTSARG